MDAEYREKLERLRADIKQGLESGAGTLLDEISTEEIVARGFERLQRERRTAARCEKP